jgi:hypothetical protein
VEIKRGRTKTGALREQIGIKRAGERGREGGREEMWLLEKLFSEGSEDEGSRSL